MDDVAHVRLVDAHAERVRGHHDGRVVRYERALAFRAVGGRHACVIARRPHARGDERRVHLVGVFASRAVHDAAFQGMLQRIGGDARDLALGFQTFDAEVEVRAVEPGDHLVGVAKIQKAHDVAPHALRGRGRERRHGGPFRKLTYEVADGQIRRAEVLAPLRNAVRLVHGDERQGRLAGEREEARVGQALGRHVHDLIGARQGAAKHRRLLPRRERGVEVGAAHAGVQQGPHLVAHERHERAHHQRQAVQHDARHLVAHRLARPRGHDRERVAPGQQRFHHALLSRAERVVPKVVLERLARLVQVVHVPVPSPPIPLPDDARTWRGAARIPGGPPLGTAARLSGQIPARPVFFPIAIIPHRASRRMRARRTSPVESFGRRPGRRPPWPAETSDPQLDKIASILYPPLKMIQSFHS